MESDFSVLHRIDDPYALPGPVFTARLQCLPHYPGAVRARALAEYAARHDAPGVPGDRGPVRAGAQAGQPAQLYRAADGYAPVIEVGH